MLSWFTGSSRPSEDLATPYGEEEAQAEDPPETPAPQFAIRALRSALLGTPHIKQNYAFTNDEQTAAVDVSLAKRNEQSKCIPALRSEPLASPTKGILVTPGTAASKRKTVSFGSLMPQDGERASNPIPEERPTFDTATKDLGSSVITEETSPKEKEATMTKSRFEAKLEDSKRRISKKSALQELEERTILSLGLAENPDLTRQAAMSPQVFDATVDLNVPCSISGKHWKGEFEQYHRKSNRELKRVIQHGQTIKSYAQKKDSEVTSLNVKLNNELAKVAAMEAGVSKLASELANARNCSMGDQSISTDLFNELAKQTALAIRYKQQADRYKSTLGRRTQNSHDPEQADDCVQITLDSNPAVVGTSESQAMTLMRNDLGKLRAAVETAEGKSSRVQQENMMLKQKMARVKEEMKSYETRRLARDERLRKRETKLRQAKESCETKLADLTTRHQELLHENLNGRHVHGSDAQSRAPDTVAAEFLIQQDNHFLPSQKRDTHGSRTARSRALQESPTYSSTHGDQMGPVGSFDGTQESTPVGRPASPLFLNRHLNPVQGTMRKVDMKQSPQAALAKPQESSIDLWTRGIQDSLVDDTLPVAKTPIGSGFSILQRETHDALQELDQNTVRERQSSFHGSPTINTVGEADAAPPIPEPPNHKSILSSAVRRMQSRRSTIASPRPSLLGFASSPAKPDAVHKSTDSGDASNERPFETRAVVSRTSTMATRGAPLPPDRAEAARKRLKARKVDKR